MLPVICVALVQRATIALLCVSLLWGAGQPLLADAKKAKGLSDKEAQQILDDADKTISDLLIKTRNRQLLSPEDSSKIEQIQLQLPEIVALPKPSPSLPKVLFQTAQFLERREQYQDAAEWYNTLSTKFADSAYAAKAKTAEALLKKTHPKVFASE
jgi:hypothetical protein